MAIPPDLRLDHSGGHYRKHPSPLVDQIARAALAVDAASCCCVDYCFPPVARLLEICPEPLFKRELLRQPSWLSWSGGHPARKTRVQAGSLHDETGTDACITKSPLAPSGKCS